MQEIKNAPTFCIVVIKVDEWVEDIERQGSHAGTNRRQQNPRYIGLSRRNGATDILVQLQDDSVLLERGSPLKELLNFRRTPCLLQLLTQGPIDRLIVGVESIR